MKIVLVNLSNNLYEESRQRLNTSAQKFGIKNLDSYDFSELIKTSFYKKNSEVLMHPRGLGYWLWKPYLVLEAFKNLQEGDIVIYSDCGIEIIGELDPLIELCEKENDIILFGNSNYTNKIWTKRDCFILMECDTKKYWDGVHYDAAFCLFKKSAASEEFLKQWLHYGSNISIISDLPNGCGKENLPEFIQHRWDQSILSLLAIKNGIMPYRMPTQFGNHYKIQSVRIANEYNCLNQGDLTQLDFYSSAPYNNSFYLQLLDHHRKKAESHTNGNRVKNSLRDKFLKLKRRIADK